MTYKRPGVFIEETLTPLARTDEASGASTAVFVGVTKGGGPTEPTRVSSWAEYVKVYGGFGDGTSDLPFAVYEFFNNGGGSCLVVRGVTANAVKATVTLTDGADTNPVSLLDVVAISPGAWGNDITVTIGASTGGVGTFDFSVAKGTGVGRFVEAFREVSLDPASPRYLPNIVNSPYSGSTLVRVTSKVAAWVAADVPNPQTDTSLAGGTEGSGSVDLAAAAQQLEEVAGVFDVNLPGVNDTATIGALVTWAEGAGNVFLVVDGAKGSAADSAAQNATAQTTLAAALPVSSTVAVYGPWLLADDPSSAVAGAQRLVAPGGFVLGQYARTDTLRGVQKPAAGIDAVLRGVLGPQFKYSQTDLDNLNTAGVNAMRVVPGVGTCIFGARTLSKGMPDRYLNIRRTLITVKRALINLTTFAVFETNDENLRQQIEDIVSQYLRTQWAKGLLAGETESQAFSVQCDNENNTPATIESGFVNISVGVAPQTPAEFIVFNIGQTISGTTVDENA